MVRLLACAGRGVEKERPTEWGGHSRRGSSFTDEAAAPTVTISVPLSSRNEAKRKEA